VDASWVCEAMIENLEAIPHHEKYYVTQSQASEALPPFGTNVTKIGSAAEG